MAVTTKKNGKTVVALGGKAKSAGHKARPSAGAQVIDIGVARRRATGGRS
jgi:hypothetical protein